ncbi:hypothetical protein PSTEL_12040 [Paenibacillus stellifer]|uniref:Polymerase/histidinol phosphatase N-terminal domain-containing protein n=1 Tax=Paenibacillus stellifer TaxID=169760 RepID=A0A089LWR9_9BACL|nr:hypothetical protein PSTEL_12040 [Paenibacillus stellifer]
MERGRPRLGEYIDLHVHTHYSDGSMSPSEIIHYARSRHVGTIAITDHDTIAGVREGMEEGGRCGVRVIPGIELSADYEEEMHILGYFIDINSEHLIRYMEEIRKHRTQETIRLLRTLKKLGMPVPYEELLNSKGVIDINSIIHALIKLGYAKDRRDAVGSYLGQGRPAYIKTYKWLPADCINLIKAAGGIAVLAHPVRLNKSMEELKPVLAELIRYGLDGIECYHSEHTDDWAAYCLRLAKENGLRITGGSDFHGSHRPGIDLAHGKLRAGMLAWERAEESR